MIKFIQMLSIAIDSSKAIKGFDFKPFVGLNYSFIKQFAYEEKNAGNKGLKNNAATMEHLGAEFGVALTLFTPLSETHAHAIAFLPKIAYTNFVKMRSMKKKIENVNTSHQTIAKRNNLTKFTLCFFWCQHRR